MTTSLLLVHDAVDTAAVQSSGGEAWWCYAPEVLDHLRLPYRVVAPVELAGLPRDTLVVVPGPPAGSSTTWEPLLEHLRGGATALLLGGPGVLASALGVELGPDIEAAEVSIDGQQLWAHGGHELSAREPAAEIDGTWSVSGRPAVVTVAVGSGRATVWGVDVWQSIVRIQQGWPVTEPGPPAPDGSVPRRDTVLRADDGLALPFERRHLPPGALASTEPFVYELAPTRAAPMYDVPEADLWRVSVLRCIVRARRDLGRPEIWLHYWPAGVDAIAHMSHDSDRNIDSQAVLALETFAAAGVSVTWCQCHPGGYSAEVVAAIGAEHEQALHYNAMQDTPLDVWGYAEFHAQHEWARELTGQPIVVNKNHYTRWEGWTEQYEWCDRSGIELDQTRGPSKQGDVGFPFGSAHLWRPMAAGLEGNRLFDVLELPLHTQDLHFFAHESIADPILDQSRAVHGVAHFLFHGPNLEADPPAVDAVHRVVAAARERGMPWWTAGAINAWERARRSVTLELTGGSNRWRLVVTSTAALAGAGVVIVPPDDRADWLAVDEAGQALPVTAVRRHGWDAIEIAVDLHPGEQRIELRTA